MFPDINYLQNSVELFRCKNGIASSFQFQLFCRICKLFFLKCLMNLKICKTFFLFLNWSIRQSESRCQQYFKSVDLILISKSRLISVLTIKERTRKLPPSPLQGKETSRKVRDYHSGWHGQQQNPSPTRKKDLKGACQCFQAEVTCSWSNSPQWSVKPWKRNLRMLGFI